MNNRKVQTVLVLLVLASLTVVGIWPSVIQDTEAQVAAQSQGVDSPDGFEAGEVLVKFKEDGAVLSMHSVLMDHEASRIRTLHGTEVELWQVPEGQELEIVEELNANPAVEYAEPNYVYRAFDSGEEAVEVTPNDPYFGTQWAHTQIQSPAAWAITTGNADIVVAILDTGVDLGHPDLAGKLVAGYDFVDDDNTPEDRHGHGTHIAGVTAAASNNGIGIAGVDWEARIMPVRVLDRTGSGLVSDIVDGIYWSYQQGAKVLNLSLGAPSYSQTMQDAITAAHEAGSLVVAAMGNCRIVGVGCPQANPTNFPAAYANVMAVAATGPTGVYASYSQYGNHCDVAAPGGDMDYLHDPDGIYSAMPTYSVYMNTVFLYSQNYDYAHGTSQAAPHVAGLAALVWGVDPARTPGEVQSIIQQSATDLGAAGWDPTYGHGLINALASLESDSPPIAPTLLPIENPGGAGSYLVRWSAVSGSASYTLQEAQDLSFASASNYSVGAITQRAFAGKPAGTTWYYRVRATNANGTSPWSNVEWVTVAPSSPPLNPIDNASDEDEYVVSWSAVSGATSYTLGESVSSTCVNPTTRYKGTLLQYQVTGQNGGLWYYCVRASNEGGNSPWSTTVSTTVSAPALTPPTLHAIQNDDLNADYVIEWDPVLTTPVTYTLEESRSSYFVSPRMVYSGTALQHAVTGQPGGTWYYRIRAFGQDGKSPWGQSRSVMVMTKMLMPIVAKGFAIFPPTDDWTTIMSEDFEGTFPNTWWEVNDNNDPLDGVLWGQYYWAKRECNPCEGSYSAWPVGDGLDGQYLDCSSHYPNNVDSWMVYGPFSLVDATDAILTYEAWVNVDTDDDKLCHMASIDGTLFYGTCTSAAFPQAAWIERIFDLKDVYSLGDLRGEPQVWIALVFVSDALGTEAHGAYADNLLLLKSTGSVVSLMEGGTRDVTPAAWDEPAAFEWER